MRTFVIPIFLLVLFLLCSATGGVETSAIILRNPPNNNVLWSFQGNQAIDVYYENGNVLGIACVCAVLRPIQKTERLVLLPKGRSKTFRYDIFGQVPISWQISIGTNADVALIYGYAEWDSY